PPTAILDLAPRTLHRGPPARHGQLDRAETSSMALFPVRRAGLALDGSGVATRTPRTSDCPGCRGGPRIVVLAPRFDDVPGIRCSRNAASFKHQVDVLML